MDHTRVTEEKVALHTPSQSTFDYDTHHSIYQDNLKICITSCVTFFASLLSFLPLPSSGPEIMC